MLSELIFMAKRFTVTVLKVIVYKSFKTLTLLLI